MPSRKIISILIVCAGLVTGIITASGDRETAATLTAGLLSKGPQVNIPKNDTWQKDLSPLILKQNDFSTVEASSTSNVTDRVSESLMANYISLRQSGNLNDTSAQILIEQAVKFSETGSTIQVTYTTGNIIVSPDNSKAAITTYGAELGNVFKTNKSAQTKSEILLFSQILESQDKSRISELKDAASIYRHIIASIRNIKVPSSYSAHHIEVLNNLDKIASSIDDMALIFDDPIRSMQAIGTYEAGYAGFSSAINKIRFQIIKTDKVIYKQGESGYYLYYGL
jgi:hypothetical protein